MYLLAINSCTCGTCILHFKQKINIKVVSHLSCFKPWDQLPTMPTGIHLCVCKTIMTLFDHNLFKLSTHLITH